MKPWGTPQAIEAIDGEKLPVLTYSSWAVPWMPMWHFNFQLGQYGQLYQMLS